MIFFAFVIRLKPATAYSDNWKLLDAASALRTSQLVPKSIPIYGYIYDVKSGKLIEVPAARAAGRAT